TAIAERVTANNVVELPANTDLALAMVATPGPVFSHLEKEIRGPTLVVHTAPLPFRRNAALFERGAHLVVPSIRSIPADCVDPRVKQRSRIHWWLAEQEVQAADPDAHALLLDHDGHITETGFANFLIVRDGTIVSPPLSTILNGVSLQVVRELAA